MLFRPTVAPARPCRVPREVREFMALALELAVVPAARGREEEEGGEGTRVGRRGMRTGREERDLLYRNLTNLKVPPPAEAFLLNIY